MELPLFCLDPWFLFCDDGVREGDGDSNPSLADASTVDCWGTRVLEYRYYVEYEYRYGPLGNTMCMGSEGDGEGDGEVPVGTRVCGGRMQEKWPILRDCDT